MLGRGWTTAALSLAVLASGGIGSTRGSTDADAWLIEVDGDGQVLRQWTYGGAGDDVFTKAERLPDGGVIACGITHASPGASEDAWIVRLAPDGSEMWARTVGGAGEEFATSVLRTVDGGFLLTGATATAASGPYDAWVAAFDAGGTRRWLKQFGKAGADAAYSVRATADGGYLVSASVETTARGNDLWFRKIDASGKKVWAKTKGGRRDDGSPRIIATADGGYAALAYTKSYGAGSTDIWLLKLDANADVAWERTFGGAAWDEAAGIVQHADGGFVIAGYTQTFGAGSADVWLIRTDASGARLWDRTFGGGDWEEARGLVKTPTGYLIAGHTRSFGAGDYDVWLVGTNESGEQLWTRTLGGPAADETFAISDAGGGTYLVAGRTFSRPEGR